MTRSARTVAVIAAIMFVSPAAASARTGEGLAGEATGQPPLAAPLHETFQPGDVFVGANSGKVEWHLPDGTLNKILDTGEANSETTGMAFDFAGNLYVTAFQANKIYKFDNHGDLVGPWGSGFDSHPESIVFNADGIAYVGQADGARRVLKFLPDGTLIDTFAPDRERRGTDWLDLASDQCLLRYTSEGTLVKQFDACTRTQLADWASLPATGTAYALRMIGDDTVIVADWADIRWLDMHGGLIRSFDAPNQDAWFALNLDPDGKSFWSANYFTGLVHRFDLTTGQVLATFQSTTSRASGLAVYGEFHAGAVRSCDAEDLSGDFGRIDPNPGNDERVTVVYDARMLAQQDSIAIARAMAQVVKDRAEATLREYRDDLDLPIPDTVQISIKCAVGFLFWERDGRVPGPGAVDLKVDMIRNQLADAARKGFPAGDAWNQPGAWWKDTLDHELFHTVQFEITNLGIEVFNGNNTQIESVAYAGVDLIAEPDDVSATYLRLAGEFAQRQPHPSLDRSTFPDDDSYRAPSVLQYWGERFGPQNDANLEHRVAQFLAKLMAAPSADQVDDFGATIGYDWTANTYGDADPVAALRDYYLAHYALRASNASAANNSAYAILDAETGHGLAAGQRAPGQAVYPEFSLNQRRLVLAAGENAFSLPLGSNMSGDIYEFTFPAGTTNLAFHLDSSAFGDFSTAIVPVQPNDTLVIDPDLMFSGPASFAAVDKNVQVVGSERVALVFVRNHGPLWGANLELKVTPVDGQLGLAFLAPLTHQLRTATSGPIVFNVRPTIDGDPVTGDLPRSVFRVKVGTANAAVRTVDFRDGTYHIEAWAPATLANGTYPLTITFAEQDFADGDLVIGPAAPQRRELISAGSTPALEQGQTASASAPVTPGASEAAFGIEWPGSTFNLWLISPTGRIIPSTSTDPDVTVVRTATSVKIAVASPEGGEWDLQVQATDVPVPEAASYSVTEADAPLAASLNVAGQSQAGLPIDVVLAVSEPTTSLLGARVVAQVEDPSSTVRRFQLRDDGASGDGNEGDGVYGGQLWATDLPGEYQVSVNAVGTTSEGAPVQRLGFASVTLGPKNDTDGDGVADAAEPLFGLDPADPTDGTTDQDGDGLTLPQELAAGSDPGSWDGDDGGESDRSELAAGRAPAISDDDVAVETPALGARALDGRLVSISARTTSGADSVRAYRITQSSTTDLGLHPADGTAFEDGPLPAGEYSYVAVAVAASGAESGVATAGPLTVGDDVTPPDARITLNQGNWETSVLDVPVTFTDLTESVSEMRLALSEVELATASWVPFTPFASVTLPPTLGQHFVYAQVRDQVGNASPVATSFVFLVDTTPPVTAAGPLDPQYTTGSVEVPFTASDDLSGVASVELWWRNRATEADPWGVWTLGPAGVSSPLTFSFASGDGFYELYTIGIDAAGNREAPPLSADTATTHASPVTTGYVTRTFSFATSSEGWSGGGTNCTSQHTAADGVPAGSLSTTVSGKNKTATCVWRSPLVTWQDWGVPAGATVIVARLESAKTRIAGCSSCQSGQINEYRLETGPAETVATLWAGRTLPASQEPWQTTGAQPDQQIGSFWQGSNSQIRLRLDATLKTGNPGSSSVTLRQDEIVLVITYQTGGGEAPDYSVTLSAVGPYCPEGQICTDEADTVTLDGRGTASAGSGPVAVEWRLYGVRSDGSISLLRPFSAAAPVDGTFDEAQEDFTFWDVQTDQGFVSYDVEIRATAGGVSTTRTERVDISRCNPAAC